VPHFKTYNSMMPLWGDTDFGNDQLYPVYAGINQARAASAALRSSNRYFINQTNGAVHESIFSIAKYETAGARPNHSDVVFGFMNLDRNNPVSGWFNVNINSGGSNLFGIQPGRQYNTRNIAAYTAADASRRDAWLWGNGVSGADLLANGLYVGLNKVPTSTTAWINAPFEAQYLKLSDVTPPPTPAMPSTPTAYVVGTNVTFQWLATTDPEGGISGYRVLIGTASDGSNIFNGIINTTNQTASGAYGQTLYARVSAINLAGIEGPLSPVSFGTLLLDPAADHDDDGLNNAAEVQAGTDPLSSASVLRIVSLTGGGQLLTWASAPGKTYQIFATTNLAAGFTLVGSAPASGGSVTSFTNATAQGDRLFYRVAVLP
jgi:hypothetical protein